MPELTPGPVPSATYTAAEVAALLGVSEWGIYQAVRNGTIPFQPIKIGRRLVWPRAIVDRALGLSGDAA